MRFDYLETAADVDELLAEFGQAVTIRTVTTGAYDPATGGASSSSVDSTGTGAEFDFGLHLSGASFTAGTVIVAGDKQLLLSPVGISEPQQGSFAIISGVAWSIAAVKVTGPAGVPVLFELLLRK